MTHSLPISRRTLLQNSLLGAAAFGVPAILAGCSNPADQSAPGTGGATARGTVSMGSNASDEVPKKSLQTVIQAFTQADVKINTVDHNTFQENITTVPAGQPGRRVHLVRRLPDAVLRRAGPGHGQLDDVWDKIGADYTDALQGGRRRAPTASSTSSRSTYYPWAVFYRKSLWQEKGYTGPDDAGTSSSRWPPR